jgi:hypothetical protein
MSISQTFHGLQVAERPDRSGLWTFRASQHPRCGTRVSQVAVQSSRTGNAVAVSYFGADRSK